jgi:hypothetical protein
MAYGISVLNNSGHTQIDQSFVNYSLKASGSFSVTSLTDQGAGIYARSITIAASAHGATDPLVFIRPSVLPATGADSKHIAGWVNANSAIRVHVDTVGTYQWQVYEKSTLTSTSTANSGSGLNVYTAGGDLAFSSNYPNPAIFAITQGFITPTSFHTASFTHGYSNIPYGFLNSCYFCQADSHTEEGDGEEIEFTIIAAQSLFWTSTQVGVAITELEVESGNTASNWTLNSGLRFWAWIRAFN